MKVLDFKSSAMISAQDIQYVCTVNGWVCLLPSPALSNLLNLCCCLPSWDLNTTLASRCGLSQWFPMESSKSFIYFNFDLTAVKFVWKSRFIRTNFKVWHCCSSCANTQSLLLTRLIKYLLTHPKVLGGASFGRVLQEGLKVIQGHTFPVGVPSQTAVQLAHSTCMNRSLLNPLTTGA